MRASRGELRFVLASLVIPAGPKLLWLQTWILDPKGHGCWLDFAQMAERLGLTQRTVEDYTSDLMHYGLLERIPPGRTQSRGYVATVPEECRYRGASPDPDTIIRGRSALDSTIGRWRPPDKGRDTAGAVKSAVKAVGKSSGTLTGKAAVTSAVSRPSSAFDSLGVQASSAVEVPKADEVRGESTSTADEVAVREIDSLPAERVAEAGFASLREIVARNVAVQRARKVTP